MGGNMARRLTKGIVERPIATPLADWSRSLQRLQLAEHGRDQFCDSRMNVHGALNHRVWRLGVHHVQEGMNYLIALDPQERRSKNLFRFGIHQNFHESVRLAFLPSTADLRHRHLTNESFPS